MLLLIFLSVVLGPDSKTLYRGMVCLLVEPWNCTNLNISALSHCLCVCPYFSRHICLIQKIFIDYMSSTVVFPTDIQEKQYLIPLDLTLLENS